MSATFRARRPFLLTLATLAFLSAATRPGALDAAASLVPWTDLTDADALSSVLVRKAVVDGRTVHYPTPTKELESELATRAAAPGETAVAALRHLAEARRELGNLPGAEEALSRWAEGSGGAAWVEAARWGATYRRWPFAFDAAHKALASDAPRAARKALASDRIAWAEEDPSRGDPLALRAERAALFPSEAGFVESWIRALEKAGRLKEADEALRGAKGLPEETRLLVLADLKGDHGDPNGAFAVLEAFVGDPAKTPSSRALEAFARRADAVAGARMETMRLGLEKAFDARALTLLARWFEGKGRSDLALELLQQVELRHEAGLSREGRVVTARLYEALDADPEAFRSRLAGAAAAKGDQALDDLDDLARLALAAGARPIAWGALNDEPYRWAARTDVTPGFTTAGLSFLLTGLGPDDALAELEAQRLPEKTLRAGRLLLAELERRSPKHPAIPGLYVKVMDRLVERGKGDEALGLLARAEAGDAKTRAEARRVALLAMRQTKSPLERERALWVERLVLLAPDGSVPGQGALAFEEGSESPSPEGDEGDGGSFEGEAAPKGRLEAGTEVDQYGRALDEAIVRLDDRDRTHRASLSLLLGEMDRLPRAEAVWLKAVDRLSSWKLDDDLEPRYRKALAAFEGPEWWKKLARWYARRQKSAELKALGEEIVASFRGSALFARDPLVSDALVALEGQPNPYILFSDFIALRALQRFPASPAVLERAESRLLARSSFDALKVKRPQDVKDRAVVDDALLALRRDAVLFADPPRRARFLDALASKGSLEAFLVRLEPATPRTPVEDVLLLDGWARLSRFERAVPFAEALAEAYPGDATRASEAISLERSLSAFSPERAAAAERIAARAAAAAADPSPFFTPIGEMWQDLERPVPAGEAFRRVLIANPRDPETILETATALWDYGRFSEALAVLSDGRARLGRPSLHAFEAGVLKEELRDRDGAITEYVAALSEEGDAGWRARERLAKLVGRPSVRELLLARIARLAPGRAEDEASLGSYLPLGGIGTAETTTWDDWMDLPNDPVGRAARAARREEASPAEERGSAAVGEALWKKSVEMAPRATSPALLLTLRTWLPGLADARWAGADGATALESLVRAREVELLPSEDARVPAEAGRAAWLLERGRTDEARAAWAKLRPRVDALPDGVTKIRALAGHARFLEATGGDAAGGFRDAVKRFPWSLGLVEDQVAYLYRSGRDADGLDALEAAAQRAAAGHREPLTERLVNDALARKDLVRARRAVGRLLAFDLEPRARVGALALSARLAWREGTEVDPIALAKAESPKLPEELRPDLWAALATAARAEGKLETGVDLYVEALNRRTEREWLREACRLAVRANRSDALLEFFNKQRARSPRDVRWAVAVREIRAFQGDLDGAVAAAKEAVAVAPEREELTRETVALLERGGRFREAADFLEAWARTRLADEGVATWRAGLYVRAGDVPKALAVDRASIAAVRSRETEEAEEEAARRTARAARRYLRLGRASAAWELAAPGGDPARVGEVPLGNAERAEIALRAGTFPRLFARFASDDDFLQETGWAVSRAALPEQREALEKDLLGRIFRPDGTVDGAALTRLHPWAESAGLRRFDEALSRRRLAAVPPAKAFWGPDPPASFVATLRPTESVTGKDGLERLRLVRSDFHAEWVRYIAAREDDEALRPALAPLVADLNAKVTGTPPVTVAVPYASWFPVEAFARLAARPENAAWRSGVDGWFRTAGAWKRFLAATGTSWNVKPLVPLLAPETRRDFFLRGAPAPPPGVVESPPRLARNAAVDRTAEALEALVAGAPGAAANADVVRLRGPRSVGELLGSDPRFTWPEIAILPGDRGDDLVVGSGVDAGRAPARLWGLRPSASWFVLEALARLRERAVETPFVPLEAASRGGEPARALAAVRSAQALGDLPLALSLDEAWFADLAQAERLGRRLRLLVASGVDGKAKADALLREEVRNRQEKATEPLFRAWERNAVAAGLALPAAHLDPSRPVGSGLLAYLCDREGPEAVAALSPSDQAEYRSALASRWASRLDALSADRLDLYLREVWSNDLGAFPRAAASKLPPNVRDAAPVLALLPSPLRADGLAAALAFPDTARLTDVARRAGDLGAPLDLLFLRADIARGDDDAALARLRTLLERPGGLVAPLVLAEPDLAASVEGGEAPPPAREAGSPVLRAYRIVRAGKRPQLLEKSTALLLPPVEDRIASAAAPADVWELAFELKPAPERAALLADLERSWTRGEWSGREEIAALVGVLARKDRAAGLRWFARLPEPAYFQEVRDRATLLVALKDVEGAKREWVAARARAGLTEDQEVSAFDAWRQLGGDSAAGAPSWWTTARGFWQRKGSDFAAWGGDLAKHLAAHPYDRHAARVVYRSVAPAPERFVAPAALASSGAEDSVSRWRVARAELARSATAARAALRSTWFDPDEIRQRRFPAVEAEGLLGDLARIGAAAREESLAERALSALEDRRATSLPAVTADVAALRRRAAPRPETLLGGGVSVTRLLPRDLTWDLYARVLNAEDVP
jgi:tetratricopeptide (TPR) repeat protein